MVAALPGYLLAIWLIDSVGRRRIQTAGFAVMAICYVLIGLLPGVTMSVLPFLMLFGVSYLFTEFGPNTTTFVYPSEMFPLRLRTAGHGICAAMGKAGACAGTYLFPAMLAAWGIGGAEVAAGVAAAAGMALTIGLLPETRGRSLEQISADRPVLLRPLPAGAST